MERLTSREPRISGLPGVCCTHFTGSECQTLGGCCTEGCPWEDAAWERLAAYEDIGLTPEEIRERLDAGEKLFFERVNIYELFQAKKDGRTPVTPKAKTYDAHAAEAEYLLGVLWNGLHNTDGMDARAADRVAENDGQQLHGFYAHERHRSADRTAESAHRSGSRTFQKVQPGEAGKECSGEKAQEGQDVQGQQKAEPAVTSTKPS